MMSWLRWTRGLAAPAAFRLIEHLTGGGEQVLRPFVIATVAQPALTLTAMSGLAESCFNSKTSRMSFAANGCIVRV